MQRVSKLQQGGSPDGAIKQNQVKTGESEGGSAEEDAEGQRAATTANLDSGYAWVILLVMFLLQSSIGGAARVYGLVYSKEVELGYYDREQASWPIATASTVENLAGILSPALVQWMSWRNIELASTSLLVTANFLAYMSNSLALDIVSLGLIQGMALSSCTVLTLLINNDYFDRYRATAFGVSMCGSTFGLLYLGPLVTWLLGTYDNFRLVYLALAGVFCVNMLLVLFIRPRGEVPKWFTNWAANKGRKCQANMAMACNSKNQPNNNPTSPIRKRSRFETRLLERRDSVASISHRARSRRTSALSRVALGHPNESKHGPSQQQQQRKRQLPTLIKSKSGIDLGVGRLSSAQKLSNEALMKKISLRSECAPEITPLSAPLPDARLPIPAAFGSRARISRESSLADSSGHSSTTICMLANPEQADLAAVELDAANLCRWLDNCISDLEGCNASDPMALKTDKLDDRLQKEQHELFVDVDLDGRDCTDAAEATATATAALSFYSLARLLRLPYLHCAWIMLALYYLIARIFVMILADFARDHGLDARQSISLINYWSLGELLGRLLLGSLIDLRLLSLRSCIALTCALLASLMACMVLIECYLVYALCSTLVAALISLEYMLVNVMMVEYVGKRMLTNCYSLAACIASIILFGRPSMIGFFRDTLGSYDGLILSLSVASGSFGVLFYLLEPLLVRHWPKSEACRKNVSP